MTMQKHLEHRTATWIHGFTSLALVSVSGLGCGAASNPEADNSNAASVSALEDASGEKGTCELIQSIRVCDRKYVDGKYGEGDTYMCGNFSGDFYCRAKALGLDVWQFAFGCSVDWGHYVDIVRVQDGSVNARFCVVEPQCNELVACWYQSGDTPSMPLPPWIDARLQDRYPGYKKCVAEGHQGAQFIKTNFSAGCKDAVAQ